MSDLIERQAAIDALDTINSFGWVEESWEKVCSTIENVPAAQPEQRWIPVSDRPKKDGRYRVTRLDYVTDTKIIDILWYEKNTWWNRQATGDYAVIAWMPLPKPYRVESEE